MEYMELAEHIGHPLNIRHRKDELVIECQKCDEILYAVDAEGTVQGIDERTCRHCGMSGFMLRYDSRTGKSERTDFLVWCKVPCGDVYCGWCGCKNCYTAHVADNKHGEGQYP
jgi:hypothetical protein